MDEILRQPDFDERGNPVYSVEECLFVMNEALKRLGRLRVRGEVSSVSIGPTGHAYFSVSGGHKTALLKCVMWRSRYEISGVDLVTGMEVIISGTPNVYAPRGDLNLVADTLEPAGEGALHRAYLALKAKLESEGLFASEVKRPLPSYPVRLGLITSLRSGTVVHDFMNNLGRFGFLIEGTHSRVEGKEAVGDLLSALDLMATRDIEALIIMRGGGSIESLQAFDNERVVRRIREFPVPVIAAIGHHKDVPLAALAADEAVSTPTAAARAVCREWERATSELGDLRLRILGLFSERLQARRGTLNRLAYAVHSGFSAILGGFRRNEEGLRFGLQKIEQGVRERAARLEREARLLEAFMTRSILRKQETIKGYSRALEANSPERQLKLGYSIVRLQNGRLVRSVRQLERGSELRTSLSDGTADSTINSVTKRHV